jgi:hypothetical protein
MAYNSINSDQIGEESMLRSIMKITAPCWTQCIYRYPPLANQIWVYWRNLDCNDCIRDTLSENIAKDWRKNSEICDNIIKACPFCNSISFENVKKGNLEHLHLYCPSIHLKKAREHCNWKIEEALTNLYIYAAKLEYNCTMDATDRNTTLHENLINAAKEAELQERHIVKSSCIVHKARNKNIAIRSRHEIQMLVLP